MADLLGNKWATVGEAYGPVLQRVDLLLLQPDLELHPILAGMIPEYVFDIVTGRSGKIDPATEEELPFPERRQPATLPRVAEIVIISRTSPWCTTVQNPAGVTIENIIASLFHCYREPITPDEEGAIPARTKEQMKRAQRTNQEMLGHSERGGDGFKRRDFLRTYTQFEALTKEDTYCKQRLGFSMPNVFVLHLQS